MAPKPKPAGPPRPAKPQNAATLALALIRSQKVDADPKLAVVRDQLLHGKALFPGTRKAIRDVLQRKGQ